MNFYDNLKRSNVPSSVINTPPAAQLGCGLSVKVSGDYLHAAKRVFSYSSYSSYLGLFRINYYRGRYSVDRA